MSFLKDLRFPDPEGLVNRAAFNERFETLNRLNTRIGDEWVWEKASFIVKQLSTISNVYVAYGANSTTIKYSDSVKIGEGDSVQLVDPTTIVINGERDISEFNVLIGKYFTRQGDKVDPKDVFLGVGNISKTSSGGTVVMDVYPVVADKLVSYLNSPDPNAYPPAEPDGYTYTPLGQLGEKVRIAKGEYTGTGTYGSANPNTLTFDFEPKLLLVTQRNSQAYPSGSGWTSMFIWKENMKSTMVYGNGLYFNRAGNSLSYYTDGSVADRQMNQSGVVYDYIALG